MEEDLQERLQKLEKLYSELERNISIGRFRVDSTSEFPFGLVTDKLTGIMFFDDGSSILNIEGTSQETVGRKLKPSDSNKTNIGKIIQAINGDIVLNAKNGTIYLDAKHIRINGGDPIGGSVVISGSSVTQINSPSTNIQGDSFCVATNFTSSMGSSFSENHGEISNDNTSGTDEEDSSFFGKILAAIKRFKKFFNSICEAV